MKTKDNQIPVLSGTSKDHKKVEDSKIGPDVRPIMGAMIGPNVGLANFGSMIVRAIANECDVNKNVNWYKNPEKSEINYKSVLFVPPTPGGILAKELKKRELELELDHHTGTFKALPDNLGS